MEIKVEDMTEKQAKKLLKQLLKKLDELDYDDFFGTEGWLHFFEMDE